jgi:hypothetical protein
LTIHEKLNENFPYTGPGAWNPRRVPGRASWRKVLRVLLPPLVYHAVRILGKSSGSFLPSTLPRKRCKLVSVSPGVKKYKMIKKIDKDKKKLPRASERVVSGEVTSGLIT